MEDSDFVKSATVSVQLNAPTADVANLHVECMRLLRFEEGMRGGMITRRVTSTVKTAERTIRVPSAGCIRILSPSEIDILEDGKVSKGQEQRMMVEAY